MSTIAAHFENLRRRFSAASTRQITNAQHSFEAMQFIANAERPPEARCAYFEIGGTTYLVWEMDAELDRFQVFATLYNVPLGILRLSSKPSGIIVVAGFEINLGILAEFIAEHFKKPAEGELPVHTGGAKRNLLLFGYCENFGHHFWNEVCGLTSVMESGLFDGLDGFVIGPFDYFNLGPVLKRMGKPVWKMNSLRTLLPDRLLIYHNNVVTEEARRLIIDNAAAQAPAADPQGLSICFQIRRHRRSWAQEEEKLAGIITAVAREWPEINILIDGHSTSKGTVSAWEQEIESERLFYKRLASRLDPGINILSVIGMDINAKINLMKNVDLFVGPIGSGGVLSSWLLRKPTIAYGPTSLYGLMEHQEQTIPEGGPLASIIPPEEITDLQTGDLSFDVNSDVIFETISHEIRKMHNPLIRNVNYGNI